MAIHHRPEHILSSRAQGLKRPSLVCFHQSAIAHHVGDHDRGKAALGTSSSHALVGLSESGKAQFYWQAKRESIGLSFAPGHECRSGRVRCRSALPWITDYLLHRGETT